MNTRLFYVFVTCIFLGLLAGPQGMGRVAPTTYHKIWYGAQAPLYSQAMQAEKKTGKILQEHLTSLEAGNGMSLGTQQMHRQNHLQAQAERLQIWQHIQYRAFIFAGYWFMGIALLTITIAVIKGNRFEPLVTGWRDINIAIALIALIGSPFMSLQLMARQPRTSLILIVSFLATGIVLWLIHGSPNKQTTTDA